MNLHQYDSLLLLYDKNVTIKIKRAQGRKIRLPKVAKIGVQSIKKGFKYHHYK